MKLYHFSEESDIEIFKPRVKPSRQNMPPVVWAIDEQHEFTFYFPRKCPRIVYTKSEGISERDYDTFFGLTDSNIVITVETDWYKRINNTITYRYEMPGKTFTMFDEFAGYYISEEIVEPIGITVMDHLVERLAALNIEIRLTPNLYRLREAILESTVKDFGIHQFANAKIK